MLVFYPKESVSVTIAMILNLATTHDVVVMCYY